MRSASSCPRLSSRLQSRVPHSEPPYQGRRSRPRLVSGRGPRPRSARAPHRARGGGSGGRRARARGSSRRRCRPAASRSTRGRRVGQDVVRTRAGARRRAGRAAATRSGSCHGRERGELIGAEQQDEARAGIAMRELAQRVDHVRRARSRSISRRETVNTGLPSAAACARRRRIAGDSGGAGRCGGRPVGTSTTRESPSCQAASWQSSRWPRCGGLQSEPSTPTRGCRGAHHSSSSRLVVVELGLLGRRRRT